MASKKHRPEEAVAKLRQVDVLVSQGQSVADAVRSIGVTEVTYYRWRQEYGGLRADQVKRLKQLEAENARLRRAVADNDFAVVFLELLDRLEGQFRRLRGRCLPYGEAGGFWALGEIVKAQAGILETDPPAQASARLQAAVAALVSDASEGEWLRARLAPLLGIAGPDPIKAERAELFAAWRRFVEALAAAARGAFHK